MSRVNREEFLRRLSTVEAGLAHREIVEQSSCFVFRDGLVCAFNDEVYCQVPSGLDDSVTGAVPAKPLLTLLGKLPEDTLEVEVSETELTVKGKGRKAGIRLEAEILLPVESVEQPEDSDWRQLPNHFLNALDFVRKCASMDASSGALVCVHIHPKWVESCDMDQYARYRLKTGFKQSAMIRGQSVQYAVTIGATELAETANWIHFRSSDIVLSFRRYTEEYPDLSHLLAVEGDSVALPKGLADAADKAEVFSGETPDDNLVLVELRNGKVRVKGMGASGWYLEAKKVNYTGPALKFLIAPKLLAEIVTKHNECVLNEERLKVEGESWTYITSLAPPEELAVAQKESSERDASEEE